MTRLAWNIFSSRTYYFENADILKKELERLTPSVDWHDLLKSNLKTGPHLLGPESTYLQAFYKYANPSRDLQLDHIFNYLSVRQFFQNLPGNLLEVEAHTDHSELNYEQLLKTTDQDALKTLLKIANTPANTTEEIIAVLSDNPERAKQLILDTIDPIYFDLLTLPEDIIQFLNAQKSKIKLEDLARDLQINTQNKAALLQDQLDGCEDDEAKCQLLLSFLPEAWLPLLNSSPINAALYLRTNAEHLDVEAILKNIYNKTVPPALAIGNCAIFLAGMAEQNSRKPEIEKQQLTQPILKVLQTHRKKLDQQLQRSATEPRAPTDVPRWPEVSVKQLLMRFHHDFSDPDLRTVFNKIRHALAQTPINYTDALAHLNMLPLKHLDAQKMIVSSIGKSLKSMPDHAQKDLLLSHLEQPITRQELEKIFPIPRKVNLQTLFQQCKDLFDLPQCLEVLDVPHTDDIEAKLISTSYELACQQMLTCLKSGHKEAIMSGDVFSDPTDPLFSQYLLVCHLSKKHFQKAYFSLGESAKSLLSTYENKVSELKNGALDLMGITASSWTEKTNNETFSLMLTSINDAIEAIINHFPEDHAMILMRMISSAQLRSTSEFECQLYFNNMRNQIKNLPWLRDTDPLILALMNNLHEDFETIESHYCVGGYRVLFPDASTNEIRRHQLRNLILLHTQRKIFNRIKHCSLSRPSSKMAENFFTVGASRYTIDPQLRAYKARVCSQLYQQNPGIITKFAQQSYGPWLDLIQTLVAASPSMTRSELINVLQHVQLTPAFIFNQFEFIIDNAEIPEEMRALMSNKVASLYNLNNNTFCSHDRNSHNQKLNQVAHYIQLTESLSLEDAQVSTLTRPKAVKEVILAHSNFVFGCFLHDVIEAVAKSNTEQVLIYSTFDGDPLTLDLGGMGPSSAPSALKEIPAQLKIFENHNIEFNANTVTTMDNDLQQLTDSQAANADRLLKAKQLEFDAASEDDTSFTTKIYEYLLRFLGIFFPSVRATNAEFDAAQSYECVRAESLCSEFVRQTNHLSLSTIERLLCEREQIGHLPQKPSIY